MQLNQTWFSVGPLHIIHSKAMFNTILDKGRSTFETEPNRFLRKPQFKRFLATLFLIVGSLFEDPILMFLAAKAKRLNSAFVYIQLLNFVEVALKRLR